MLQSETLAKRKICPHVQMKLLAKNIEEQLKLTHRVVKIVDRPHRMICVTMLRYNVEKPETSYPSAIVWNKKVRRKIQSICLCGL